MAVVYIPPVPDPNKVDKIPSATVGDLVEVASGGNIADTGILSSDIVNTFGGVSGDITLGTNLSMAGNQLNASGGGGGGGSPGGNNGDIQINQSGSFGTLSGLNLDQTGNPTGTNSLDIQSIRNSSSQAATGNFSHAIGSYNTVNGCYSNAFGNGNTSSGNYSNTFGGANTASGYVATSSGYGNTSSGVYGQAFGFEQQNNADHGVAVGLYNTTTACGQNQVSLGYSNTTCVANTSAIGICNIASGTQSSGMGYNNTASGNNSSAFGNSNTTYGVTSTAIGFNNTVSGYSSTVVGACLNNSTDNSTEIGYTDTYKLNISPAGVNFNSMPSTCMASTYYISGAATNWDGNSFTKADGSGNITVNDTSWNSTGPVSASNLSGTNTGDQDLSPYALMSSLATVATTGSYTDLTNQPSIPAAQVNSDWTAVSGVACILNKPVLGSAAACSASSFDASGSAATAQSNAETFASNASNLASGTVNVSRLPSIDSYLPSETGNSGKFLTTNGSVSSWGSPSATAWGTITGTLSSQTDLQTALNAKQSSITTGTTAQYFKGDLSLGTFPTNVSTFSNDANYLVNTRNVNTSAPLTGGGNLTSDLTLALSAATQSVAGSQSAQSYMNDQIYFSNFYA